MEGGCNAEDVPDTSRSPSKMPDAEAGLAYVIQLRRGLHSETAFVQNMLRQVRQRRSSLSAVCWVQRYSPSSNHSQLAYLESPPARIFGGCSVRVNYNDTRHVPGGRARNPMTLRRPSTWLGSGGRPSRLRRSRASDAITSRYIRIDLKSSCEEGW